MLSSSSIPRMADPEGEYAPLVEAMGDVGTVIRVAAGGKDRLNAMYMVDGYGENNPIVVKSQFIMSLVEQPEPAAKDIALSMELFTTGSLDIFGHKSTVDLDKRVVVFDIHGLGEQLKPLGHLVITDTILNRVTLNWRKGKRTHIFIGEFHVMFENAFSAAFFNSAWRQFRKRNAYPTAITQKVEFLLDSVQASTIAAIRSSMVFLLTAIMDTLLVKVSLTILRRLYPVNGI